ncbi:MAG: carbon-nitrogen hydrolase family protein [bacterium]|nr:carbon-nitrogen hydrolase family protein [bacterium]
MKKSVVMVGCLMVAIFLLANAQNSYAGRFLSVAIGQANCSFNPDLQKRMQTNLASMTGMAKAIKKLRNPDMIVFPEVFIHGPDSRNFKKLAEPIPEGPSTQALIELAKELKVWLLPGTLMEKGDDGLFYNTAIVISPEGEFITKYRKIFPARPFESSDPGNDFVVFDIPGKGRIGIMISFDIMYPEIARTLAWMGAEVIIKPACQSDMVGGYKARTPMDITRAIENQCYFVDCNVSAPIGNGYSCIVDPEGRIVEKLGSSTSFTSAILDLDHVRRIREYGSFGGGFTLLKHWAYLSKVKEFPPYQKGIQNGEVFKSISKSYADNPLQIKHYGE